MKPPYFSTMQSGNRSIVLEDGVDYDSFPRLAERWAVKLSLAIRSKADGLDERVWECERNGTKFWLAYNLEPQDADAAAEISSIGSEIGADEKSA
jgi:hypothetical protein